MVPAAPARACAHRVITMAPDIVDIMTEARSSSELADLPLSRLAALSRAIHRNLDPLLSSRNAAALSTAESILQHCAAAITMQGVFSSNEDADDLSTSSLPLLLVPFTHGQLLSSCPSTTPQQRARMVHAAASHYSHFLQHLQQYGLLGELAARYGKLCDRTCGESRGPEVRMMQSNCYPGSVQGPLPVLLTPHLYCQMSGRRQYAREEDGDVGALSLGGSGGTPSERREAKIERFKAEKAIKAKIEQIESRRKPAADEVRGGEESRGGSHPHGGEWRV